MFIGSEIVKINPSQRSAQAIRGAVNTATKTIVDSIFGEMRPFFTVPNRELLFRRIEANVLTLDQLAEVRDAYVADLGDTASRDPDGVPPVFGIAQTRSARHRAAGIRQSRPVAATLSAADRNPDQQ
jgi:hypothetical protein